MREVVDQERILVPGWPTVDLPSGDRIAGNVTSPLPFLLFVPRLSKLSAHSNKAILGCQSGRYGRTRGFKGVATLDIDTKTLDGVKIIKLSGRLSMGPALDRFNATIVELLGHGHSKIVLDLEEVPTIDSSGIGMLVRHLTTAKQAGGTIRLLKPSKFTLQTLKMVGLLNLFTTFDDEAAAISSFQ